MKIKSCVLAVVLAAGAVSVAAAPAQAFGELTVISYHDGSATGPVIGQRWFGCPGQSGQWGELHGVATFGSVPC